MRSAIFAGMCAAMCSVFTLASTTSAKTYTYAYQRIVELENATVLDIRAISGTIEVIGSDDNRIVVDLVKRLHAPSLEVANQMANDIEFAASRIEDTLRISALHKHEIGFDNSVLEKVLGLDEDDPPATDLRIQVPYNCPVIITSRQGPIRVRDMQADIQITSVESAITLTSIDGDIKVINTSGRIEGEFLYGNIDIRHGDGDIGLAWVEGDVQIRAASGHIAIKQARGTIQLATRSGDVTIQTELDSPKDYVVETVTGTIKLAVPQWAVGKLDIQTESGNIRSEIPLAVESASRNRLLGRMGTDGGPLVKLTSSSGDVRIAMY